MSSRDASVIHGSVSGWAAPAPPHADPPGGPDTLTARSSKRLTDPTRLLPGDLVLFDASTEDGADVDHVGTLLGHDPTGAPPFISSRKTVDGPTPGHTRGPSTLSGSGLYATSRRAVRRLCGALRRRHPPPW